MPLAHRHLPRQRTALPRGRSAAAPALAAHDQRSEAGGSKVLSPAVKRVSMIAGFTLLLIGWGGVVSISVPDTRSKGFPNCALRGWSNRSVWFSDALDDRASPLAPGNNP
jgi:hypothetical protein